MPIVSSIRRMLLGNNSTIRIIRWVHRVRCSAEMFLYSIYAEDGIICNSLSNMFGNSDNNSLLESSSSQMLSEDAFGYDDDGRRRSDDQSRLGSQSSTPAKCEAHPPSVEEDGHELKIRRIHLE